MTEDTGMEGQPPEQKSANLARIRDNQRRSRARRKEYLSELETKFRQCEQVGVEASAEIQAAARRVIDENRRLRLLLRQHGYSDAEIDGQVPSVPNLASSVQPSNAAGSLEDMLAARRPCRPGSACKSSSSDALSQQRPPLASSSSTTPARSTSATASTPDLSAVHAQLRPPLSHSSSRSSNTRTTPAPAAAAHQDISTAELARNQQHSAPVVPGWNYDMVYDNMPYWTGQEHMATDDYTAPSAGPTTCGTTSCYTAAHAIRSYNPDLGYELEEELGCADGKECNVANAEIFRIMDRYQGPSG